MEVLGIPAHPMLVHAAVVFVPLLALTSIAYAVVARVRPYCRWVVTTLAFASAGSITLAKLSGDSLRQRLIDRRLELEDLANGDHKTFGNVATLSTICLAVTTLALVYVAPGRHVTSAIAASDNEHPPGEDGSASKDDGGGDDPVVPSRRVWTGWRRTWIGRLPTRSPEERVPAQIRAVLAVGTLGFAIVSGYYVTLAGHTGADMVWSGM